LLQQSIELYREMGDRHGLAFTLANYGVARLWAGKFTEGQSLLQESLSLWIELGRGYTMVLFEAFWGLSSMLLGQYSQAREQGRKTLAQARRMDYKREAGFSLFVLAGAALAERAFVKARDLAQESIALYQQVGQPDEMGWALAVGGCAALGLGDAVQAKAYLGRSLQIGIMFQAPAALAFTLPGLALLLSHRQEKERAVELYALAVRYPFVASSPWFEDVAGRHIAAVAASLPREVVAAAQERGRARDLWETADELLAQLGE
jgi:tetratricopeptide (TPR) repeat protein